MAAVSTPEVSGSVEALASAAAVPASVEQQWLVADPMVAVAAVVTVEKFVTDKRLGGRIRSPSLFLCD
jgi:hypothetical protein